VLTTGTFQQAGAITNLVFEGGTLAGTNRVGQGTLTFLDGDLRGKLTVEAGGVLEFGGTAQKTMYSFTLVNLGKVLWSGSSLFGGSTPTTVITNAGLWEITGNNTFGQGIGGPALEFHNLASGTLRKTIGSGTSAFNSFLFENLGRIETLSGTLTLPAGFISESGTLLVGTNALFQTSDGITVNNGRVEGAGSIKLKTMTGGVIAPGIGLKGRLTVTAGLPLGPGVTLAFDVAGTSAGTNADQIQVTGTVNLNNAILSLPGVTGMAIGSEVVLIDNDGTDAVVGTFAGIPNGSLFTANEQLYRIWYTRGTGNDVVLIRDSGGVLLSSKMFGTGEYLFQGRGTNFATYTIYAATNLVAPVTWMEIGSSVADPSGLFQFKDTNAFRYPMRFYYSDGP
jgi:fibronectin-binding autotransporter adhesin